MNHRLRLPTALFTAAMIAAPVAGGAVITVAPNPAQAQQPTVAQPDALLALARQTAQSGDLQKASIIYGSIIQDHSGSQVYPDALIELAQVLFRLQKPKQALKLCQTFIKTYPSHARLPEALLVVGDFYFDAKQNEMALKVYEKVSQYPQSPVVHYARYKAGWCHYNAQDYVQALTAFMDVVKNPGEASPDTENLHKDALTGTIVTYAQIGNPAKARIFFEKLTQNDAALVRKSLVELQDLYNERGMNQQAETIHKQLTAP